MGIPTLLAYHNLCNTNEHESSFGWSNIRNALGIAALVTYTVAWIGFASFTLISFGLMLFFTWMFFLLWLPFDFLAVVMGLPATLFHILACKNDEGVATAFYKVGLTHVGISTLTMYGFLFHLISWALVFLGVGLILLFFVYLFCGIVFILAIATAFREEYS